MKRLQLAIRGVLVEGDWINEPYKVKNEFLNHFSNRFSTPSGPSINLDTNMFKQISFDQNVDLESDVTYDEIKKAVWDCGTNKSPGLDGFTFDFIHRYWKIINQDVVNSVREFFVTSKFPPGCNSSFITLIPKKQYAKVVKDFRPISLIGSFYKFIAKILANCLSMVISDLISDVQSAFVSNRQILDGPFILNELITWCKYNKTKAMIFKVDFEKDFDSVKWGYLDGILSNFGFGAKWRGWIQGCLTSAMGWILGIHIDESLTLSHLFYADDAIFIGLKINIHKSKLMGIGVSHEDVNATSNIIRCSTFSTPFNYLGVKVGMSSSRSKSWDEHMLIYKAPMGALHNMESFRRRFFNGVDKNEKKISMIGWKKIIIRELGTLSLQGINLLSHMKKKVGNGVHTLFWEDSWITDIPLSHTFPRLYALENEKHITIADKLSEASLIVSFRRALCGGMEEEQYLRLVDLVASVTLSNSNDSSPTRWVKVIPIKINIFAWIDIPTRLNLSLRGIDIPSIICPICSSAGESCSHLLFSCIMARLLLRKVARWWDLDIPE
ncbi:RNA-directed DNA polymerase, eukaryota, partial [Tanacetum coccineum]